MGVKGLQTYVEKNCPQACENVDLKVLAQDYKAKHGKKPILVVDGLSCVRDHFYHRGLAWVYGGQWQEYLRSLQNFVQKFTSAGIKVVFIFDGVVEKSKRRVWISRRKNDMKTVKKIFQDIKSFATEPKRSLFHHPPGTGMFAGLGLKSLGVCVYHSMVEADRETAGFAFTRDCFGILSQDSDFLIYDTGTVSYFSARGLNRQNLTTVRYCVDVLCEHLGLERSDLPLLSCLLGNDVIPSTELKYFQSRVARGLPLIPALARFINDLSPDTSIPDIAQRVFSSPSNVQLFVDGMLSYILPGQSSKWPMPDSVLTKAPVSEAEETFEKEAVHKQGKDSNSSVRHVRPTVGVRILQEAKLRHQNTQNIKAIYEILTVAEGDSGALLEDEYSGIPPSTVFYQPIRERLCGVLYGVGVQQIRRAASRVDQCSRQMSRLVIGGEEQAVVGGEEEVVVGGEEEVVVGGEEVVVVGGEEEAVVGGEEEAVVGGEEEVVVGGEEEVVVGGEDEVVVGGEEEVVVGGEEEVVVGQNAVKEWFVYPGCELKEPDILQAKPLDIPGGTPTLEELWFGHDVKTVALRWRTFMAGMDCSIPTHRQKAVPWNLKVLVVVVHYMVKHGVLEEWEVDAFLIQALLCTDWYRHRGRKVPVDSRAVQLASLFMKGVAAAMGMNCACGWPLPMDCCLPWLYFDGKFFHFVYLQARSGTEPWDLCRRNDSTWELFLLLKDCVSYGRPRGRQSGKTDHCHQSETLTSPKHSGHKLAEGSTRTTPVSNTMYNRNARPKATSKSATLSEQGKKKKRNKGRKKGQQGSSS